MQNCSWVDPLDQNLVIWRINSEQPVVKQSGTTGLFSEIQALRQERERHDIRQKMRGAQTGEYVDVISDTAHGIWLAAQAANDSANIFMDASA